jgi:hypothetical protein
MVEAAAKRRSFTMPSVMQELYYGGGWHSAKSGETVEIKNPATGESLGSAFDLASCGTDRPAVTARYHQRAARRARVRRGPRGASARREGRADRRDPDRQGDIRQRIGRPRASKPAMSG